MLTAILYVFTEWERDNFSSWGEILEVVVQTFISTSSEKKQKNVYTLQEFLGGFLPFRECNYNFLNGDTNIILEAFVFTYALIPRVDVVTVSEVQHLK